MIAEYRINDKYSLKYNNKALRTLEQVLGVPISNLGDKFQKEGTGINDITEIFRIGLMFKYPDITIEQVDDIIDDLGLSAVSNAIQEAFKLAFGSIGEEPKN